MSIVKMNFVYAAGKSNERESFEWFLRYFAPYVRSLKIYQLLVFFSGDSTEKVQSCYTGIFSDTTNFSGSWTTTFLGYLLMSGPKLHAKNAEKIFVCRKCFSAKAFSKVVWRTEGFFRIYIPYQKASLLTLLNFQFLTKMLRNSKNETYFYQKNNRLYGIIHCWRKC